MTAQAMNTAAIEFRTKPFPDQDLLAAIQAGLARDRAMDTLDELGSSTRFAKPQQREHDSRDSRPGSTSRLFTESAH